MEATSEKGHRIRRAGLVVRSDNSRLERIASSFKSQSTMADKWQIEYVVIDREPKWYAENHNRWTCAVFAVCDESDFSVMRNVWNEWSKDKSPKRTYLCFLGLPPVARSVADQIARFILDKNYRPLSYLSSKVADVEVLEHVLQLVSAAITGDERSARLVYPAECSVGVVHLSDLHADAWDSDIRNNLLQDIRDLHLPSDRLLLVTGDLTHRGRSTEYRAARDFLASVGKHLEIEWRHILVCPGNHDLRPSFVGISPPFTSRSRLRVFRDNFPSPVGAQQYDMSWFYIVEAGGLHVGLFSIDSTLSRFLSSGKVDVQTLQWMERTGKNFEHAFPDGILVVLVHHHVLTDELLGNNPAMVMKNNGQFNEHACRGGVDLVLHGHEHLGWRWDLPVFGVDDHTFHVIPGGTATIKEREKQKNSKYNVLWLCKRGFYLESREYRLNEFELRKQLSKEFVRPRSLFGIGDIGAQA